jgi:DNA-binding GntR family transcriptional regulator
MIDHTMIKHMNLPLSSLQKVKPVSVGSQVASRLREAILQGELKPGQRIVERHLALTMGVSQVTVREVLQSLEHEGLVTKKANTATHVTELSGDKLRELIEVRLHLEPLAMCLASKRISPQQTRELELMAGKLNQAIVAKNLFEITQIDFAFHRKIWQISGNETLARTLAQLCTPYFAYIMILNSIQQSGHREQLKAHEGLMEYFKRDLKSRVKPHQVLLDALKEGNATEIENAVREHVLGSWSFLLNQK